MDHYPTLLTLPLTFHFACFITWPPHPDETLFHFSLKHINPKPPQNLTFQSYVPSTHFLRTSCISMSLCHWSSSTDLTTHVSWSKKHARSFPAIRLPSPDLIAVAYITRETSERNTYPIKAVFSLSSAATCHPLNGIRRTLPFTTYHSMPFW